MAEMKDLFGRSKHNAFTFFDKRKKLIDWESDLEENSALSSYFMQGNDVVKTAPRMLGKMLNVVGLPKGMKTTLHNSSPYQFQVPLNMILNEDGEYVEDLHDVDKFFGACIQRASLMKNIRAEDYAKMIGNDSFKAAGKRKSKSSAPEDTIFSVLQSCIYQEMGDKFVADNFPGYLKFVQKQKMSHFEEKWEAPDMMASKRARFLDTLVRMLRYPTSVTEDEITEFGKYLAEVERAMKSMDGFPSNQTEADKAIRALYKIVHSIEDEEEEPEEEENEEDNNDGDGDGDGDGTPPPLGGGSKPTKAEADQKLMEALQQMMSLETDNSSVKEEDLEEFQEEMTPADVKIDYNKPGVISEHNAVFKPADTDEYRYKSDLDKIPLKKAGVLKNLFTMKNKDHKFTMKSMKSGKFDESKLVEARAGVPTVYERMGVVKTDQICIVILVDESGSMNGYGPGPSSMRNRPLKIDMARQAATYMNEVFGKLPNVELFIYGHTEESGSHSTIRVYKEPGSNKKFTIGSMHPRGCNRDGEAIYACAKRVRSKTDKNGIYLVISDGQPAGDNYSGQAAIEDTRQKVKMSERLGFQVIQVAIDSRVPSEQMFTHFIKFENIESLPSDMVRYLSRKVNLLMKERVSF